MEVGPLTWLESLEGNSIDMWIQIKVAFTSNFAGAMQCPSNRTDLSQIKQQQGETLRSYLHHFVDKKATIVNITERDVIDCFQNGLYGHRMFQDFGRRRPEEIKSLKIMIQAWADEKNKEIKRFKSSHNRNQNNNNQSNGQCNDKNRNDCPNDNEGNYLGGQNRKRKLDNTVTAMF